VKCVLVVFIILYYDLKSIEIFDTPFETFYSVIKNDSSIVNVQNKEDNINKCDNKQILFESFFFRSKNDQIVILTFVSCLRIGVRIPRTASSMSSKSFSNHSSTSNQLLQQQVMTLENYTGFPLHL